MYVNGYRGVHHLALNTDDMKATLDFYVGVLGFPLVHAMRVPPGVGVGPKNRGNPPFECVRHYFLDIGNDTLLAFFEIPKGAMPEANRNAIAGMQHVSFTVTPARGAELRAILQQQGIECIGPIEALPGLFSTYFLDPIGIRLEICEQPGDGADIGVVRVVQQTRAEAQRELESLGAGQAWMDSITSNLA